MNASNSVTKFLKRTVENFCRGYGYDIRKIDSDPSVAGMPQSRMDYLFESYGVDLVLDAGANTGQYASRIQDEGFGGDIVSFEPVSSAHKLLCENQKNSRNPKWHVFERVALGDKNGSVEINISANSVCSSILPVLQDCIDTMEESRSIGKEPVDMRTLDSVAASYLSASKRPFLKLDVQGFESAVLSGAPETLKKLVGIQTEVSFAPLYAGQASFIEIYTKLADLGFVVREIVPVFRDSNTCDLLQADFIFFKENHFRP